MDGTDLMDSRESAITSLPASGPLDLAYDESSTVYIKPIDGWNTLDISELWRFRELIFFLVWRDVKVRYKQTILGAAWAILQPLLMMVVFSIFFGRLAKVSSGDLPYPLFAIAGLLPWTFFSTAVTSAGNSVVGSERLITKVYFPRLAVPIGAVGAAVVDFVIALGLLVIMMFGYGVRPGWSFLLIPVAFTSIAFAALGLGILLAALSVAYRDFKHVIPFMMQLGLFATPSVYMQPDSSAASGSMQWLLSLNPMTTQIEVFRAVALGGPIPWGPFVLATLFSILLLLFGCLYFRKVETNFADII
jgi:lipopolysaccharide transport system permease protein